MRIYKTAYVMIVLSLSLGSLSASGFDGNIGYPLPLLSQLLISILTFPLGSIATAVSSGFILSGLLSPVEAVMLTAPLFACLGYLQWFWLLPRIYGKRPPMADQS